MANTRMRLNAAEEALILSIRSKKGKQKSECKYPKPFIGGDKGNVLVIGDLHAPFILDGYLEFCREEQERLNCGTVVFIGDVVDHHAISFHESDPDGRSAGDEFLDAKEQLKKVFAMFPEAYCTVGNHDLLIARKAKSNGLSKHFVKSLPEVYEAPETWNFVDEVIIDGVRYTHQGEGCQNAFTLAKESRMSTVIGHLHSQAFAQFSVSDKDAIFGLQIPCGIDRRKYAFAYGAKLPKKPVIGCGAVLKGMRPLISLMPL